MVEHNTSNIQIIVRIYNENTYQIIYSFYYDKIISNNLGHLFEVLKAKYDYIIIDSAPVGLVSDPFLMRDFSDIVLYIIRNQKTTKKQLDFVNEVVSTKSLSNVNLILNDIKDGDQYGYGYGSKSGYDSFSKSKNKKKKLKTI